jgi:hypothetical protein
MLDESNSTVNNKELILTANIINANNKVDGVSDLESQVLLAPEGGFENSNGDWLLVNKNVISHNGTECDKIGVSMDTFYNQSNKCGARKGSCLKNQIYDLLKEDSQRKDKGQYLKYVADKAYNRIAVKGNNSFLTAEFEGKHMSQVQ